jgi:hypothetical protein
VHKSGAAYDADVRKVLEGSQLHGEKTQPLAVVKNKPLKVRQMHFEEIR